jgi:hypothetical protein
LSLVRVATHGECADASTISLGAGHKILSSLTDYLLIHLTSQLNLTQLNSDSFQFLATQLFPTPTTMSSYAQLTSMLPSDSTLTAGQIAAMDHFDDTLKFCLSNWYNDKTSLVLSDNVQDLYGLALSNYFQHSLEVCVGGAVALTTVDDSNAQKTVVHMPKRNHPQPSPQVQPDMSSTTETSERNVVNLPATHVGKKKVPHVPRPMNSWMHFRDEKHNELKAENPTISVQ